MLYDLLFPWQKQIIDKFEDKRKFALYLDMGLGKTPVSLAFAERHHCNKIIIVSIEKKAIETADVDGSFLNWSTKMEKKYNAYTKQYSFNNTGSKKWQVTLNENDNDILIINYESLYKRRLLENLDRKKKKEKICELKDNILDFIKKCKDQRVCVIIDECHKLKDLDSLQSDIDWAEENRDFRLDMENNDDKRDGIMCIFKII